jgi:hypothetical protein
MKYLQAYFSQLILAEKTKIDNSGRATLDLFLGLQHVAYKLTWENVTLPYTQNRSGLVALLKETLYQPFSILIQ